MRSEHVAPPTAALGFEGSQLACAFRSDRDSDRRFESGLYLFFLSPSFPVVSAVDVASCALNAVFVGSGHSSFRRRFLRSRVLRSSSSTSPRHCDTTDTFVLLWHASSHRTCQRVMLLPLYSRNTIVATIVSWLNTGRPGVLMVPSSTYLL